MTRTTRRASLGAIVGLAAAPAAALPAHDPDAALHAVVAEARAARDAVDVHNADWDAPDTDVHNNRLDAALETLAEMTPRTLAGLAGKAQHVALVIERDTMALSATVEDCDGHVQLAHRLCLDVLALAGVNRWPEHPARELLLRNTLAARAEREANPPPRPTWRIEADAEGARLAAEGLNRPGGFTCGDVELVAWLARRVASTMGPEAAEQVVALTGMDKALVRAFTTRGAL